MGGQSPDWRGTARDCFVMYSQQRDFQRKARRNMARHGMARQGMARQGKARQGKARQGKARQGKAQWFGVGVTAANKIDCFNAN